MAFVDKLLDATIAAKERHDEKERAMTAEEKIARELKKANILRALSNFNSNNDIYRR